VFDLPRLGCLPLVRRADAREQESREERRGDEGERDPERRTKRMREDGCGARPIYYPAKEDLFYSQMESFEAALVDAVRERPVGESALAAFSRFVLERSHGLADRAEFIMTAARIIEASPTLQAREREIVAQYTEALAGLIGEETGAGAGNVEPRVVAAALMGAQRALVEHVRGSVLSGMRGPKLAASVRAQSRRAFARLERGLGDYASRKR
jgi:hypothetical protein